MFAYSPSSLTSIFDTSRNRLQSNLVLTLVTSELVATHGILVHCCLITVLPTDLGMVSRNLDGGATATSAVNDPQSL